MKPFIIRPATENEIHELILTGMNLCTQKYIKEYADKTKSVTGIVSKGVQGMVKEIKNNTNRYNIVVNAI